MEDKAHFDEKAEKLSDEIKFLQVRITELEKAESRQKIADELLRKTELQQKAILNNIPDIAWLKDRESKFIAVNDAFARACGDVNNVYAVLTGTKMFITTVGSVKAYLETIDLQ